jgi:hypothetical protein
MTTTPDPRPSLIVMIATYAVGALGVFVGFSTITQDPPSLRWASLLAVGAVGLLSFVRHSLMYRSDAARMNWDYGRRNNFQIEVGLANLAWGAVATVSAIAGLGLVVDSAMLLTAGIYLGSVAVMLTVFPGDAHRRAGPLVATASFGALQILLGVWGLVLS